MACVCIVDNVFLEISALTFYLFETVHQIRYTMDLAYYKVKRKKAVRALVYGKGRRPL